jgi:hypothetical protein
MHKLYRGFDAYTSELLLPLKDQRSQKDITRVYDVARSRSATPTQACDPDCLVLHYPYPPSTIPVSLDRH